MNFGVFKIVSQFLLNFLNTIHSVVKSYGISILVLTLVVRLVLWPLQSKANQTMRKTALLGPKMQELREKYKDDPTRMNQEVMKLYKQYGINPVGGCLPMAIQIPIFFGLYQMLAQAVELRNANFLSGTRPFATRHGSASPCARMADQHHSAADGSYAGLAHGDDAEDGRSHSAPYNDVYAADVSIFLLQFCGGSGIVLHRTKSLQYPAILSEQTTTHADPRKSCPCRKTKTMMTPKDLLDTMLGYLGFVVQIEETTNEGGNPTLQIYTEESRRLIGRDGETLEAIQFLLNRLLQARDKNAEKVIVDCEHYRSMREDRIVQRVRELAERVRITGRSLQLEPMNSYERRLVHNAFKDDPEVATWSPSDSARIKQITLLKRQPKKEVASQGKAVS